MASRFTQSFSALIALFLVASCAPTSGDMAHFDKEQHDDTTLYLEDKDSSILNEEDILYIAPATADATLAQSTDASLLQNITQYYSQRIAHLLALYGYNIAETQEKADITLRPDISKIDNTTYRDMPLYRGVFGLSFYDGSRRIAHVETEKKHAKQYDALSEADILLKLTDEASKSSLSVINSPENAKKTGF